MLNSMVGETKTEKIIGIVLIILLMACLAKSTQKPTRKSIYLEIPVETPNGVQFSWNGGEETLTYSLYRRKVSDVNWERIELGLPHQGAYFAPGFTLSDDYQYQIKADLP